MNKEHVTKGPVYEYQGEIREDDPVSGRTLATVSDRLRDDEIEPNAELIAEAFNVLHETGMTPRELANALSYLKGKMGSLCDIMPDEEWADQDAMAMDEDLSRCRHIIDDIQAKLEEHQPVTTA